MSRFSVRVKYTAVFIAVIIGVVVAICFFNLAYFEKYAVNKKMGVLEEIRSEINEFVDGGFSTDERNELNKMSGIENVQILMMQNNDSGVDIVVYSSQIMSEQESWQKLQNLYNGEPIADSTVAREGDGYTIYRTDDEILGQQLECIGSYNDISYIISTPMQTISDNASLSNAFYAIVGITGAAVGGVIIFFITGRMIRPIKKLENISKKVAELDFSERYDEGRSLGREIDHLGESINNMSERLQESIGSLREANVRLEEDIREKELIDIRRKEFISNVSHELKTPIALIQGYAEGLKDGVAQDPESIAFYCDVIIDESSKMNTIVRRLLNLGEIENGTVHMDKEMFNLTELLRGIMQTAKILAGDRNVELLLDAADRLDVFADEILIEEVVKNYLSNAYNHVTQDGIIKVTAYADGSDAIVKVFNTGAPIPNEDLDSIWEKFYKVDKAHTRKYGGTGLGLSIVKAIMNAHGGTCSVRNLEDGVEFEFALALDTSHACAIDVDGYPIE